MKRRKIRLLITLIVFALSRPMSGIAGQAGALPVLSSYRIPADKKGAFIGKVIIPSELAGTKIVLLKDTSGLFRLDKAGNLSLKRSVSLKSATPQFCYVITIGSGSLSVDFNLVKDEFIRNPVIAHRGAWKNHPGSENSISSLKNAIAIGCAGSEFDVWWSADQIPVVCHDHSVGGKLLEKSSAAELQQVKLENGDGVPTLEQYLLTIMQQNKTQLVLEIKSSEISQERSLELTNAVVQMIHQLKAQAWIDYISFNYGVLQRIRELDPTAHLAYLADDKPLEALVADHISGIDYAFYSFQRNPDLIKIAHKLGLSVNVWTVNDSNELARYLQEGADLITTNEPEELLRLFKNQ